MTDDRRDGLTRALPDDLPLDFRLDPPSHSREEPAGLSDPAPAAGGPAAAVVGPAAGSGGAACDHRDTARHTRDDGVLVCGFCASTLGWGAEAWSNGVPNWHLDPATPSPPPAASISRAAAEEPAGSLEAEVEREATEFGAWLDRRPDTGPHAVLMRQAEAVGIRAEKWASPTPALDRLERAESRLTELHHRLDQSSEAWTLGVAHLTERVRALGDEVRVLGERLQQAEDRMTALAAIGVRDARAKPPDAGELAAVKERIRILAFLALEGSTPMELVQAIAAGKHLEVTS